MCASRDPPTRRRVRGLFRYAFGFVFRYMSIGKEKTFPLPFPDRPGGGVPREGENTIINKFVIFIGFSGFLHVCVYVRVFVSFLFSS